MSMRLSRAAVVLCLLVGCSGDHLVDPGPGGVRYRLEGIPIHSTIGATYGEDVTLTILAGEIALRPDSTASRRIRWGRSDIDSTYVLGEAELWYHVIADTLFLCLSPAFDRATGTRNCELGRYGETAIEAPLNWGSGITRRFLRD